MSQLHARLFEKWLNAEGDLTYGEWLTEKRERAKAMRTPGAVIPVSPAQFHAMQQGVVTLAQLQQNVYAPRPGAYAFFGGALGGIFGKAFPR